MTQNESVDLDKVFKALGSETRRKILRMLSQSPSYPYQLAKDLELTSRGVFKHLEALREAGLVEREAGESDVGPDRVYYRLSTRFGLSTTILPEAFAVRLIRREVGGRVRIPRGFVIPEARRDVAAVKELLSELGRVNRRISQLDDERMRFSSLRGRIIRRIEDIMSACSWDDESCERVRSLIDPIRQSDSGDVQFSDTWTQTVREALKMFESLFAEIQAGRVNIDESEDVDEINMDSE